MFIDVMNSSDKTPDIESAARPVARPLIAVIDDDNVAQTWLRGVLAKHGYPSVCYGTAEAYFETPMTDRPACVLLDLRLPGMSGQDFLARIGKLPDAPAVVMITANGDVASARAALRAGATDFLEKPLVPEQLLAALEEAVLRDAAQRARVSTAQEARENLAQLTEREREVFFGVTDGRHNREIADQLGISVRTVEAHRARLMDKLGAPRLSDLFRLRIATDVE